ncbi:MAG: hypothetical protein ACTTJC_06115 [Campylobacter sp.]
MKLVFSLFLALFFVGCAQKPMIKTVYKDVFIPISCVNQMPLRPIFDGTPKSAKELMSYLLTCEALLKGCVNGE